MILGYQSVSSKPLRGTGGPSPVAHQEFRAVFSVKPEWFPLDILTTSLLSFNLLLEVVLDATLLGFAVSAHLLIVCLTFLVARDARESATESTLGTASNAFTEIGDLASGLLLLALKVLFAAGGFQGLSKG
jgi:hypothetical protein